MTAEEKEQLQIQLLHVCDQLGAHWTDIQILVTRVEADGSTQRLREGRGNWYARKAMCQEVCQQDNAQDIAHEVKQVLPPPDPPDTGEAWKG